MTISHVPEKISMASQAQTCQAQYSRLSSVLSSLMHMLQLATYVFSASAQFQAMILSNYEMLQLGLWMQELLGQPTGFFFVVELSTEAYLFNNSGHGVIHFDMSYTG